MVTILAEADPHHAMKAWRSLTGASPLLDPADHGGARAYLDRLLRAAEQGGWSKTERQKLSRDVEKWAKRARGADPHFEVLGTRAGRPTIEEKRKITIMRGAIQHRELADVIEVLKQYPRTASEKADVKAWNADVVRHQRAKQVRTDEAIAARGK